MKSISADLTADLSTVYDQTKTSLIGRITQRVSGGKIFLGPPLNTFIDVFTDTGVAAPSVFAVTNNGRIFIMGSEATGIASIYLYNFNFNTGVATYVGRVQVQLPDQPTTTTHTYRFMRALDTGVTGWRIFLGSLSSVAISGGLFVFNNLALTDFVQTGVATLPYASGNNQKAIYNYQDPAAIGAGQLLTAVTGGGLRDGIVYMHNGVAATHQYHLFDAAANPTYVQQACTFNIASPGVVNCTGHGYVAGDQVTFYTTGTLPTGLAVNVVYFVIAAGLTANTFQVSATSGGAAINFTGVQTGSHSVGRGFGITGSNFIHKTGNLPALAGTLLTTDSEKVAVPISGPFAGIPVLTFGSTTNLYWGPLSELTPGATSWPSLQTVNVLAGVNEIITPTPTHLVWSDSLQKFIYLTNGSLGIMKDFVNTQIYARFGQFNNRYYEGVNLDMARPDFALGGTAITTVAGFEISNGWLFVLGSTVGQRGIIAMDVRSDSRFETTFVITKVLTIPRSSIKEISALFKTFSINSAEFSLEYRTSGFGSASGGWTPVAMSEPDVNLAVVNQIQFRVGFRTTVAANNPKYIHDLVISAQNEFETSDFWAGNKELTNSTSPARSAFELVRTYPVSIPKLHFRAYNKTTGVLVVDANTVDNPTEFEYSTNNGLTWTTGVGAPNTLGSVVGYKWTTPPGVEVIVTLREE